MTAPTHDPVAWLRDQIAEREELARAAMTRGGSGVWEHNGGYVYQAENNVEPVVYDEGRPTEAEAEHIAERDPRDTLAQCEAHTAILDRHDRLREAGQSGLYTEWELAQVQLSEDIVDLVALAYQHCPGYLEEWRP